MLCCIVQSDLRRTNLCQVFDGLLRRKNSLDKTEEGHIPAVLRHCLVRPQEKSVRSLVRSTYPQLVPRIVPPKNIWGCCWDSSDDGARSAMSRIPSVAMKLFGLCITKPRSRVMWNNVLQRVRKIEAVTQVVTQPGTERPPSTLA